MGWNSSKKITDIESYYNKHKDEFDYTKKLSKEDKKLYLIKKYKK